MQLPDSLSKRVLHELRERILDGQFSLGEKLSEAGLARDLGISRGPVREALQDLRAEGLVQQEPRRGAFVVRLDADDVREIYDLRAALETRAVRLMMERPADDWLPAVEIALERLLLATYDGQRADVAKADLAFHDVICQMSGNSRLRAVFTASAAVLRMLLVVEGSASSLADEQLRDDHRVLCQVLREGDARAAEAAFDRHLREARDRVVAEVGRAMDGEVVRTAEKA